MKEGYGEMRAENETKGEKKKRGKEGESIED